jgi:hypothetical protein
MQAIPATIPANEIKSCRRVPCQPFGDMSVFQDGKTGNSMTTESSWEWSFLMRSQIAVSKIMKKLGWTFEFAGEIRLTTHLQSH